MEEKLMPKRRTRPGVLPISVDIMMIIIVIVNLIFLVFDWGFDFVLIQDFIKGISNDFFIYYRDEIHPHFLYYESFFVLIFITELLLQWFISILYREYKKWWFYPLINWYDVLGCIPSGPFASLRLFRIVAMTFRLHKRGVVNLKKTEIYKQAHSTYEIFVHDAADRALVELIESAQRGVKNEDHENESALTYAVKPDQHELAKALSTRIHDIIKSNYELHGAATKKQIEQAIKDGFDHSKELDKLEHLPLVGSRITDRLEKLVSDLSVQLADSLSSRLASDEITRMVEDVINTSLDSMMKESTTPKEKVAMERQLNVILSDIMDRSLQKLKEDIDSRRKKRMGFFGVVEKGAS